MKWISSVCLLGLVFSFAARADDPVAQLTFRVRDDFGNAVAGAPVVMTTAEGWRPGRTDYGYTELREARGLTDTNGVVVLNLSCKTGNIRSYSVLAEGTFFDNMNKMRIGATAYYRDMGGELRFSNVVNDQWQPWNPTVDIQLKAVIDPIPMYARFLRSQSLPIPVYNQPLGYDLIKSDWLPPHGKGETADFVFRLDCQLRGTREDGLQMFDAALTLSFSNDGDGIQEVEALPGVGSVFRLSRFAPESGYKTNWVSRTFAHENDDSCEYKENQNFFYRVRTKKEAGGQIISALYGKIVGPIFYEVRARGANMQLRYYLNPTPNDRNMEFDPSRNLFTDLASAEQVKEP